MTKITLSTEQQREHGGGIPERLRERDQWVVTRNKAPYVPCEDWNDIDNQYSFSVAKEVAEGEDGELAFALDSSDPFVAVDFDNVGSDGCFSAEVVGWIHQFGTYTEISRSGTGLHSILEGARLPDRQESGELDARGTVEVFDSHQYVVLTGKHVVGHDTINSEKSNSDKREQHPLIELQRQCLARLESPVEVDDEDQSFEFSPAQTEQEGVDPKDIYRTIEEYAKDGRSAAQRAKKRWHSSSGSSLEFYSASEADLGFVSDLAFWCRENERLIDKCFRQSNRMRSKWEEIHYDDGRTYGEGTIQTTVRSNYDSFSGHYVTD